jgi:hypothetical protein
MSWNQDRAKRRRSEARARRAAVRLRPGLESLEPRDLPSGAGASLRTDASHGFFGSLPPGPFLNPQVIQAAANALYGPGSATPMNPTPREIRREIITGRWIGNYTIGPPRFNDRSETIHLWSKNGGSNAFLKGKLQIALFPPANPSATPTPGDPYANQTTGVAGLFAQNYLQSGGLLILDLISQPGVTNSKLPAHFNWTFDVDSGGPFIGPTGFQQGTGTLTIKYFPASHPLPGTRGSGRMIVTFQGLYNYNAIASGVSKFIS